ncbi:MAG TPA: hypothetical protein VMF13_21460 [Luteitalea sp.]|nr:hypothetical protein [Luteitalea sp.]
MTELQEEASVLPLSVTYTPDGQIAEALGALVGRVGALAGDAERAAPFVTTMQAVMGWVEAHPEAVTGDVALTFDRTADLLQGDLRWASPEGAVVAPTVTAADGVDLTCDVDGTQVHCRVSCPCS